MQMHTLVRKHHTADILFFYDFNDFPEIRCYCTLSSLIGFTGTSAECPPSPPEEDGVECIDKLVELYSLCLMMFFYFF